MFTVNEIEDITKNKWEVMQKILKRLRREDNWNGYKY